MTNQAEEEKLISLFYKLKKLERKKMKHNVLLMVAILVFALSLFAFLNDIISFNETVSYAPDSTAIDLPNYVLVVLNLIVGVVCFIGFIHSRNFVILLLMPILVLITRDGANPLMHEFFEIKSKQYQNIRTILTVHPELISILPNYVNAQCEMTTNNYKKFTILAQDENVTSLVTDFPIKESVDDVKKMCAVTIFGSHMPNNLKS